MKMVFLIMLLTSVIEVVNPEVSLATEAVLVYQSESGFPLTTGSVSVKTARMTREGADLRITGQLHRPHKLTLPGHLHTFNYAENGLVLASNRHQITGLSSKRGGMMLIPFNILLEDASTETTRVLLEYHAAGHDER